MFGAYGPLTGRDPYRATPVVTRVLGFFGLAEVSPYVVAFYHKLGSYTGRVPVLALIEREYT